MVNPNDVVQTGGSSTDSILEDLMARMIEVLTKNQTQTHLPTYDTSSAQIGIKLDGTNYALWSQVVEMYISGKDKLGYINGDFLQPEPTDSTFRRWRTENAIVKGWLINSMDPTLISNFIRFLTAKMVWDSVATTYFDGTDTSQIRPFPTIEQTYAHVRREEIRQPVMLTVKIGQQQPPSLQLSKNGSTGAGKPNTNTRAKTQSEGGGCTHCGSMKHTRLGRAALVTTTPQLSFTSQIESSSDETHLNDQGNCGYALLSSIQNGDNGWIIDSGATDHMTFNSDDFIEVTQPRRIDIANANGVTYIVIGTGTVAVSPSLSLSNTLLVPSLSNKLMSVGQVIEELNCVTLMYLTFCLLQDILTKEIIGRAKIQVIRSDNGGEYVNKKFQDYFATHGLLHKTSCAQTPQQNGIAERKNRLILETARALLLGAHVPSRYWDDAIATTGYRCYHPTTKRTYVTMDVTFLESETFFSSSVSTSSLQGEIRDEKLNWWTWRGFEDNPVQMTDGNKAVVSEEMRYNLDIIQEAASESSEPENEEPHSSVHEAPFLENTPEVSSPITPINDLDNSIGYTLPFRHNHFEERRSRYPIANYVSTQGLPKPLKEFVHRLSSYHVPSTLQEALSNPKWSQAKKAKMEALEKSKTWALVPLLKGKKTVGCRWVFSIKHKVDGSIERYKARLVTKGYTQKYGIDYQETFSLVTKLKIVRVLLSLAANLNWSLHQFDVKNAFLHGDLKEDVYMDIPLGYMTSSKTEVVCKLQKALYRLKQSPRAWFGRFSLAMRKYGFTQSNSDHTLFLKHRLGNVTTLIIYVDGMIIIGDDIEGYTDANWVGNISDRKSTSGCFTFVGGNLVTWRSKKQKVVALSSVEAEFRGMVKGICELIWVKRLLTEIGFAPSSEMDLFCDNKAAIDIAHNPVQHDCTKHVEVDRNFIKQNLEEKVIRFPFVQSEDQLADILTKAISGKVFYSSLDKLHMKDIYAST
ncbi:hypothetical protein AAG906_002294 [Vitis piasezkii]